VAGAKSSKYSFSSSSGSSRCAAVVSNSLASRGQHAIVAHRVLAQRVTQRWCHQSRRAGAREQMIEIGQQVIGSSLLRGQTRTDSAAQRQQLVAPQLVRSCLG
jgi:hypothetical protein